MTNAPRGITFQPDIYPKVLPLLPAAPARVLDVGAGEGYFSGLARNAGYEVEACDWQRHAFRVPAVPFHDADLNARIPLPDESFDCLVAIEVVEHIENHARFFAELFRVVRKGGTVIVTTPNVLSLPSRWHYFLYGYTDAARTPLDPARADYFMQHINPITLPEILFHVERCEGELTALHTNRIRRSAWLPALLLYPFLALALRAKLLRKKYTDRLPLHRRHLRWVLDRAALAGRILIAVARRRA